MKVVDLFCGAGGFSVGMRQAGHGIVGAFDFEPAAIAVHHANHPGVPHSVISHPPSHLVRPFLRQKPRTRSADLQAILEWVPEISQLKPDIIVGGPPCQPWSTSGSRGGDDDPRAALTLSFATITAAVQPKYFIMENVPQLAKSETFLKSTMLLRNAGYGLTVRFLSTRNYGSVQQRSRLIIAGCNGETEGWLNEYLDEPRWKTDTVVKDVLGEDFGPLLFRRGYSKDGGRRSFFRADEPCPTLTSTSGRGTTGHYRLRSPDIKVLSSIDGDLTTLGKHKEYKPQLGDPIPANLLPIPNIKQMSLLAGFPASYTWNPIHIPKAKDNANHTPRPRPVSLTDIQKMLGNAVPPPFAHALGECLTRYHNGTAPIGLHSQAEICPDFRHWLRDKKMLDIQTVDATCQLAEQARAIVAARNLKTACDELKAFDNIAARRRCLAKPANFLAMRDAMFLLYEFSLHAAGVGLDDLAMDSSRTWCDEIDGNGFNEDIAA